MNEKEIDRHSSEYHLLKRLCNVERCALIAIGCTLREVTELYATFCEKYPELKIGFSKFCSLRPKWCVPVSSKGSHSVCVCIQHQNSILLVNATNNNETYKTLIDKIVCSTENKMCMLHRCEQCPGFQALEGFLLAQYDEEFDDEVQCQQWKSTDTMDLITVLMTRYEWIQEIVRVLDDLTKHSFITKCQSRYLNSRKSSLTDDNCVILLDFAENYTFTIQDEVKSYHWNQQQCTIHPAVVYYMHDHIWSDVGLCKLAVLTLNQSFNSTSNTITWRFPVTARKKGPTRFQVEITLVMAQIQHIFILSSATVREIFNFSNGAGQAWNQCSEFVQKPMHKSCVMC
ncbi:uncharacterized protein LOC143449468 [Clavelina lepadiformis]|uniref:uncharacterized protein LOC143449468 n=1 Tax=Clavelina lepadiformis TaxID=159417 RepID=UPI004042BC6C